MTGDVRLVDFAPEHQAQTAELINRNLGLRFGVRDDSKNPDLVDIRTSYTGQTFLVALLEGEVVATGALISREEETGQIVRMHTAPEVRSRGIGTRLLSALEQRARARGMTTVELNTEVPWADAIRFYLGNGYVETHRDTADVYFCKRL